MSKEVITSTSNSQIKKLISLLNKPKEREAERLFVIEGIKMFEEAKREELINQVYLSEEYYNRSVNDCRFEDVFIDVKVSIISNKIFKQISDTVTPQGIMCIIRQPEYTLDDIIHRKNISLIILESIRDPGNLGTIVRTAEGAGISGIIMNKTCVDIYNPKVIRSTMGSVFRVPFVYTDNLEDAIEKIKKENITIYAAHLNGSSEYYDEDYKKNIGFLIGNESKGLSNEITAKADKLIRIPMLGKVESLNAAVASSILMYEALKQKKFIEK